MELITEKIDAAGHCMDQWSAIELSERLCEAQLNSLTCLTHPKVKQSLASAGEAAVARLKGSNGRIIYCGAGSAGAQACIDGLELPGTFGWPKQRLVLLLAGGWDSFFEQGGVTEDDAESAQQAFENLVPTQNDVLIAVTASGSTAYTVKAAEMAKEAGALVIGVCNNHTSVLEQYADHCVVLKTGSEVVAGSTRLAAGTAQKIALNSLSTLIMAKLGYLYDNLMVKLNVTNQKLVGRAVSIISSISGCDKEQAMTQLIAADYQVPVAILMLEGLDADVAVVLLEQYEGNLRAALSACPGFD